MLTKRLFLPIILVITSAALVVFGSGCSNTLTGDTGVAGNEAVSGASEVGNRDSSNVTITITMKTPPLPDE